MRARLAGRDCLLGANPELARPLPVTGGGLLQLAEVVFRPVATIGVPLEEGQQHARPRGCCAKSRARAAVRGGALPSSGVRSGAGRPRELTGGPLRSARSCRNRSRTRNPSWLCWAAELHRATALRCPVYVRGHVPPSSPRPPLTAGWWLASWQGPHTTSRFCSSTCVHRRARARCGGPPAPC